VRIEADQICIHIRQQIALIIGIQKKRARADKRLDQALAWGQNFFDPIDDLIFVASPFEKRFHKQFISISSPQPLISFP